MATSSGFMPDYAANRDEALGKRSAIRWIERIPTNVPILLEHGTADWRVAPSRRSTWQGRSLIHIIPCA
jgi:hypothetical protein